MHSIIILTSLTHTVPYNQCLHGILVFLICSLLLHILKLNLSNLQSYFFSLTVSLLFILHPIQTQAVTYISQRFASLAALFAFSSIYCYLQYRNKSSSAYYIGSLLFALLAFKTKENTATLPLIIIMLEWLVFRPSNRHKKIIIAVIPYFFLLSVIVFSFVNAKKPVAELVNDIIGKSVETSTISRTTYLMTQFRVITTYLRLLLLPIRQSIDYYYPLSKSFFEGKTFLCFLLLLCLLIISIIIRKKYTAISVGMLWFFIFLIVESSIIPIADVIFEHRLYLPSFGFFFALTSLIYCIFHPQLHCSQSLPVN